MEKTKFQKKLDIIRKEVLEEIWNIFDKYQDDGRLNLVDDNDGGIELDYVKNREESWEQYDDGMNSMDKDGEIYTDWDKDLNIEDFTTCELVKFHEQLTNLYKDGV